MVRTPSGSPRNRENPAESAWRDGVPENLALKPGQTPWPCTPPALHVACSRASAMMLAGDTEKAARELELHSAGIRPTLCSKPLIRQFLELLKSSGAKLDHDLAAWWEHEAGKNTSEKASKTPSA